MRYLPAGVGSGALYLCAQLRLSSSDAFPFEVGQHLVDDIVIARSLEVRRDDGFGIGLCLLTGRKAQPRGRPQPEQPVAARGDPEPQFLIALEPASNPFSRSVKLFITSSLVLVGWPGRLYSRRWPTSCSSITNRLMKSR